MRIRILTLLAVLATLSLGLIACGDDGSSGSDADPQEVLDKTFASDGKQEIESADIDLSFEIKVASWACWSSTSRST
jgi:hypothetical protein